jgi:hypothetical protein
MSREPLYTNNNNVCPFESVLETENSTKTEIARLLPLVRYTTTPAAKPLETVWSRSKI